MTNTSKAQSKSTIDSLLNELKSDLPDATKVDLMLALHKEFINTDTVQSMVYIREAISLSREIEDKTKLAKSYLQLCNYKWKKGSLSEAKTAHAEATKHLPQVTDMSIHATLFMEKAIIQYMEGIYDGAVGDFIQALTVYQELEDTLGIGKCYLNIGACYWEMESLDDALNYYQKALGLQKIKKDELSMARTFGNIGLVYRAKGDYQNALDHYHQSLEINNRNNFSKDAAINLQNIGSLFSITKEYGEALTYYKAAQDLTRQINDKRGELYANHGIATIYAKMGDYDKSINKLQENLQLAFDINANEEVKNIYHSLSEVHEESGDYELALKHRKNFELWKDSLSSQNHLNRIKELEVKYETAEKNKEIELLAKDNEVQQSIAQRQTFLRNVSIVVTLLVLIIAALIVFSLKHRLKLQRVIAHKSEQLKASDHRRQIIELEMKALKAQMNPHFVFNCLNSINNMILSGESKNASSYLTKFSGIIRNVLEISESQWVSLNDELATLDAYLRLESLRFKKKVKFRFNINPDIDQENTYIPPMILQPIIENSILHGLVPKTDGGKVVITMNNENGYIQCLIEDNGIGLEASRTLNAKNGLKKKSFGLELTKKRLNLINKSNIDNHIQIRELRDRHNQISGTQVSLSIPTSQIL